MVCPRENLLDKVIKFCIAQFLTAAQKSHPFLDLLAATHPHSLYMILPLDYSPQKEPKWQMS